MTEVVRDPSPDELKVEALGLKQPLPTIRFTAPQLIAYNYGLHHKKFLLSMDKGMGKTIVYLSILLKGNPEHVVICCPTNAMGAQRRELLRHFPEYADRFVFVRGQAHQRAKLWQTPGAKIFICTAATFQTDCGGRELRKGSGQSSTAIVPPWVLSAQHFDGLGDDESHKTLRNRTSKRCGQLKELHPQREIFSSGSMASKGPQDVWAMLNIVDPKFWSSYWKYVHQFCIVEDMGFGKTILGPRNIDAWRNAVSPYIFHRKKDPRDYPPKNRHIIDIDLEPWQQKLHDSLRDSLWAFTKDGGLITAQNALDALIKIRMGMICPKYLDESFGWGAGLEGIVADAQDAELSHFAISTPYRRPLDHIERYLRSCGYNVYILSGNRGLGPDEIDNIITQHQRTGGVLLQTIKFATSYEFLGFEHNYFLGYEFDREDNLQAEDRWSRQSSTLPCYHWYIRHPNTYDEILIERMVERGQNVNMLMNDRKYWSEAGLK